CTARLARTVYAPDIQRTNMAVKTEGLGKRYGDLWAVRDVDLAVPRGSVLGLLGHNGAGKTTTIRMLTTLAPPPQASPNRHRRPPRGSGGQHRAGGAVRHRRWPDDGPRQPRNGRPPLSPPAGHGPQACRRTARAARPRRRGRQPRQDLLRRHASPARPGGQ